MVVAFMSLVLDGIDGAEVMHATLRGDAPAYWYRVNVLSADRVTARQVPSAG